MGPCGSDHSLQPGSSYGKASGGGQDLNGNTYSGPYTVSGWSMTIGPLASSRAACSTAELNTQEQQFQAALQAVTSWATDPAGIILRGTSDATLVTLSSAAK